MLLKKIGLVFCILFFVFSSGWSLTSENKQKAQAAYATLSGNRASFRKKKEAVSALEDIWKTDHDTVILDSIVKLLTYAFDRDHFREDDQKMYYDDRIAESLINLLSKTRSPTGFRILAIYVSKQNHTDATVRAAWKAIQNIDWSQQKKQKGKQ